MSAHDKQVAMISNYIFSKSRNKIENRQPIALMRAESLESLRDTVLG
jgi:hypothetical protein